MEHRNHFYQRASKIFEWVSGFAMEMHVDHVVVCFYYIEWCRLYLRHLGSWYWLKLWWFLMNQCRGDLMASAN